MPSQVILSSTQALDVGQTALSTTGMHCLTVCKPGPASAASLPEALAVEIEKPTVPNLSIQSDAICSFTL